MENKAKPHYRFIYKLTVENERRINELAEEGYRIVQALPPVDGHTSTIIMELVTPPAALEADAHIARLEATISALKASLPSYEKHPRPSDVGKSVGIMVLGKKEKAKIVGISDDNQWIIRTSWIEATANPNTNTWEFIDDTQAAQP